jgi:hypothetical protein
LWRLLSGITEDSWTDAIDMDGVQVAVADYRPVWWPAKTFLLIRRVRLDISQVSADPRSRRRKTLHPDQRALPLEKLGEADAIYGHRLIRVPARLVSQAEHVTLHPPPGHHLLAEILARLRKLPALP